MVSLHAALAVVAFSSMGQTVLLDFYSDSCGPCRAMDPVVKQLIAQGYPIRQINVQQDRATASRFHVQGIPCFVMLVNGREVDRKVGMTSAQQLTQMCRAGAPPANSIAAPPMLATAPPAGGTPMPAFEAGQYCPVPPQTAQPAGGTMVPVPPAAAQPGMTAAAPSQLMSNADLIAVTARLRIEDASGWSCGSGTIIDSRQGQALILTCGHVFRDSKGQGRVEVDLFGVNATEKVPGKVIAYDLDRDVGLVSIYVPRPMLFARVAPAGAQLRPGDAVITVGCDHGKCPRCPTYRGDDRRPLWRSAERRGCRPARRGTQRWRVVHSRWNGDRRVQRGGPGEPGRPLCFAPFGLRRVQTSPHRGSVPFVHRCSRNGRGIAGPLARGGSSPGAADLGSRSSHSACSRA